MAKADVAEYGNEKLTKAAEVRVKAFAEEIVKRGLTLRNGIKWASEKWGISEGSARKWYYKAMAYLRPEDPTAYREALIDKNFAILEDMLQKALERNDLKNSNAIIRTINTMLGVSSNKVEIKRDGMESGQTETITISFM